MSALHALILGIVEGLTEFLPVSSTGHLILAGEWLGDSDDASKSLEIIIQLGAIVAVVIYYRKKLLEMFRGLLKKDPAQWRLFLAINVAFIPAAVVGLAFHHAIKEKLFFKGPVAIALIAGGVLMAAVEIGRRATNTKGEDGLEKVTLPRAFAIGVAQCFSLLPGTSRSMTTIVGGQLAGLSTATAAEFSFLLAIETLGAATVFDLVKERKTVLAAPGSGTALAIGLVVSFVVALVVIAAFLKFLKRFGLLGFGVYRVAFGGLVLFSALHRPDAWPPEGGAPMKAAAVSVRSTTTTMDAP